MEQIKNELYFAKVRPTAKIPTKEIENAGYDIYADFEDDFILIMPHTTAMIPTGIASACDSDYALILKERGSTGTKGIAQRSGVIDSGYRGEILVPLTNTNDKPIMICKQNANVDKTTAEKLGYIIYPYEKAICQALVVVVPNLTVKEITYDELKSIPSARGEGKLGSSGK